MLPKVKRLPDGYHKLTVIVTSAELERFKSAAAFQPHGTYSEAIRRAMGMSPNPIKFARRLKEQVELERQEDE